jgi:uncharacterized delta-60 repeat protein
MGLATVRAVGLPEGWSLDEVEVPEGSSSGILTVRSLLSSPTGAFRLELEAVGGSERSLVSLPVSSSPPGNLSLSLGKSHVQTVSGEGAEVWINAMKYGTADPIVLSVEGLPNGVIANFTTLQLPQSSSAALLKLRVAVAPGRYGMLIRARVGDSEAAVGLQLEVVSPNPLPGFSIEIVERSLTFVRDTPATLQVRLLRRGGFTGPVALSDMALYDASNVRVGVNGMGVKLGAFTRAPDGSEVAPLELLTTNESGPASVEMTVFLRDPASGVTRESNRTRVNILVGQDWALEFAPDRLDVVPGTNGKFKVKLLRYGGFDGPISLKWDQLDPLPRGLAISAPPIPQGVNEVEASYTVSVDAPATGPVEVRVLAFGPNDRIRMAWHPILIRRAGVLDYTFANRGLALVDFYNETDILQDMAIAPNGKIILVGYVNGFGEWAITRLNVDGTRDRSFGTNGKVLLDFVKKREDAEMAQSVLVQPDGKILVGGRMSMDETRFGETAMTVVRLNVDGSLDPTFGTQGRFTLRGLGEATDMCFQPDGRILVIGGALVRLTSDGVLDESFTRQFISGPRIALAPGGKIVMIDEQTLEPTVIRRNADGTTDTSFGSGGRAVMTTPFRTALNGIAVMSDGSVIAGGEADGWMLLVKFRPDGTPDSGFGTGGYVRWTMNRPGKEGFATTIRDVTLQPDGRILVAGWGRLSIGLMRVNANGSPDTGFGDGGMIDEDSGFGVEAKAITLDSDGRIVVAGNWSGLPGYGNFAVARYLR